MTGIRAFEDASEFCTEQLKLTGTARPGIADGFLQDDDGDVVIAIIYHTF